MSEQRQISNAEYERFKEFADEFKVESDRAAVILGAAKLDLSLRQLLERFLLPVATGRDELLDGEAALSSFNTRINAVQRLGLIDASFAWALHLVRRIRNEFAHESSTGSLKAGGHRDRVRELAIALRDQPGYRGFRDLFGAEDDEAVEFRAVVCVMVLELELVHETVEPLRFVGRSLASPKKVTTPPTGPPIAAKP